MPRVPERPDDVGALVRRIKKLESNLERLAKRRPNVHTLSGTLLGTLSVLPGATRLYNDTEQEWVVRSVRASVGTAPVGGSVQVDVNVDGVSIFNPGAEPVIPEGQHSSPVVTNVITTLVERESYFTIDVDSVGSSTPGADLVVQIAVTP